MTTSILDLTDRPHRGIYRPRNRMTPAARIARNIEIAPTGCHLWTGKISNSGYGQITVNQAGYQPTTLLAHRVAYEITHGRIPDGLVIDHLCRVRHCVNPDHMEPTTQRENVLRSPIAPAALNLAKTHCPQNHEYTPDNIYRQRDGGRLCRTCQLTRTRTAVSA